MKKNRKYLIVPDSFKGTLSAIEVCEIAKIEIEKINQDAEVITIPVADGGEGTVDCFLHLPEYSKTDTVVKNGFGEECKVYYAIKDELAIIEMACAAGLPQAEGRLDPVHTNTYGIGLLIKDAIEKGCKEILLGLGGSCTNDGGTGMARALGTKFYNKSGEEFAPNSDEFIIITKINNDATMELLKGIHITAMCDITNPMYGQKGAAYVFSRQKGADDHTVEVLDVNLEALSDVIIKELNINVSEIPGAGAAGAMGAGVVEFLGGELKSGIETVLDSVHFNELLDGADYVFTGEGKTDSQSSQGKVVSGVAKRAKEKQVPVIVGSGAVDKDIEELYEMGVTATFSINRKAEDFSVSRYKSSENLADTISNIVRVLEINN